MADRHVLRDGAAEGCAENVGGLDAEFVEQGGANRCQRLHAHRQGGHRRAADARRVECDGAESGQVWQ
jgi:hypothetical protein